MATFASEAEELAALRKENKNLRAQLEGRDAAQRARVAPAREKIAEMSAEVVDSNPYSRLLALQRMVRWSRPLFACVRGCVCERV